MEICTLYTHETDLVKMLPRLRDHFGHQAVSVDGTANDWQSITVISGKKLFRKGSTLTITKRQRIEPGYQLQRSDDEVVANLSGMYNFVQARPAANKELQRLLLAKIETINSEVNFTAEPAFTGEMRAAIMDLAQDLDAFFFSGGNAIFDTTVQGFWDKTGALLLDVNGHSTATHLAVNIHAKYFHTPEQESAPSAEAASRKDRSLALLQASGIHSLASLPVIADSTQASIRSVKEVTERVSVLAAVNTVAFGYFDSGDIIIYLKENDLWDKTTDAEKNFLADPTEEQKKRETWKCEDIWVLLWALNIVPELGSMDALCNLDMAPEAAFPFRGTGTAAATFLSQPHSLRPASEILDANDLYYRANWACTDARIKGMQAPAHPGIVYERHYALNWLIGYRNQPWDYVTCDT
ncbi:DUF4272 domain-containing protein [Chitinophaga vietnamensis]|uniref:DUF4272 domain-containing protein n=1 Tax=Chitinophaga vietnamensis TaxID=2593957 RepID=UPI001178CBA6|nr:DUF4272 domain-containing protein [Chitinophaga vietnamensis]